MSALASLRQAPAESAPAPPPLVTAFLSPEGTLQHARCRRRLEFRGIRAELEADFYCFTCHEHLTLPKYALERVPVGRACGPLLHRAFARP